MSIDHDPFRSGEIDRVSPSTEPQREVIAAAALSPEANTAYNEAVSLRIRGPLGVEIVEQALRTLVDRHDALRTTFTPQLDALVVSATNDFALARLDRQATLPADRDAAVRETWRSLMTVPMPLCEGPLFGGVWLQFGPEDAELVLVAHHAVCDGWSFHVLLRELATLCALGPPVALPPAPSFAAFAEQQQAKGGVHRDAEYWLQRFTPSPATLDLPTDRPRPPRRTFAAHRVDHTLDPATTQAMAAAAARLRASSMGVLLAGVAALLHRLTDAEDLTLGMPVARQALDDRPNLVGHCVQLLPIRLAIDETLRFEQLVAQARTAVLDATEHFDFTFGALVRGLGLSGDAARVPLIPVLVNMDQQLADLQLGAATAEVRTVPRTAEGFELFLNVLPTAAGLCVETTFNADLFREDTIAAWLTALENLLIAGCADPAAPVRSLRLATSAGAAYGAFNATARPVVHPSWVAAFAEQAQRSPQAVAAADTSGSITYAELAARAHTLAGELLHRGVRRGSVVGMSMARSRDLLVAMAGIHLAGAAHLPLDPGFPEARLQYMLADAGVTFVVTDAALPAALLASGVRAVDLAAVAANGRAAVALPTLESHDLAYVIYTSGSTGRPKGVRVQHGALSNLLASAAIRPGFAASDVLLAISTVSFDISLAELLMPLTVGGRVFVARRDESEDPRALASLLRRHAITLLDATPATWRLLLDDQWPGLSTLRAISTGERLPRDLAAALLPRVRSLWNLYGPTETCVWSAGMEVLAGDTAGQIGTPFDNTCIYILDRAGTLLPVGVPGEICIGGLGLAEGYQNLPQLTAERFVEHLELGRLYRTGDRGRVRPSGTLECFGRMDQQVKVRGFRIELGEIESVLAEHPTVAESVAVVVEDQDGARIIAYVAGRAGAPTADDLKAHLRSALPAYMVPQQVVTLTVLPRLQNGKIDRRALPAAGRSDEPVAEYIEPETDLERLVATEMCAVLDLERIGVETDFFDAGGHSLLAAQLVARLNRTCDAGLSMRTVFEAPTARQLAHAIGSGAGMARSLARQIVRRSDQRSSPVTFVQERIWFMQQMQPERQAYNLPSAHRLRGPFDPVAFQAAFQKVVQRQSALRSTFERRDGRLWQVVHDRLKVDLLPIEDLSDAPVAERESRLLARLEQLTADQFDLGRLPLFRTRLFRLAPEEHVLFFMPHHIIWDGWSFDLLYQEMAATYGAATSGQQSTLPELPISYGDFASWHRELMGSPEAERQTKVWRERLRCFGPVRPLPVDHKRGPGMSGRGSTEWLTIDAERTGALHDLSRDRGVTLFVTTLAIYSVLLHDYSKESRLLLATPIRGRESTDLEPVMGCCNSLLPLTLEVRPDDCFEDVVARAKATVLDSFANPDVMLEQLVGADPVAGGDQKVSAAGGPVLYQALFSFQDVRRRSLQWGALQHSMIHLFQKGATEDLGLWFVESDKGLQGGFTHNVDLLTEATARRLRDRYVQLVDAVVQAPGISVATLLQASPWPAASPAVAFGHDSSPAAGEALPVAPLSSNAGRPERPEGGFPELKDLSDPSGELEFQLASIWQRLLGVDRIGLHDNFFDLGGNSLLAIRFVSDFEAATGILIDLGQLFRAPSIAGLSAHLAVGGPRLGAAVIPLQSEGAGTPIYCLRGIWVYRHLAASLGTEQPVYGVYVPEEQALAGIPLDGAVQSPSIDRLAAAYTEVLIKARPQGPFRLAGLSYGGVVAMEVARRLEAVGLGVQCVLLFDSILPTGYRWSWSRWLRAAAQRALKRGLSASLRRLVGRLRPLEKTPHESVDSQALGFEASRRVHDAAFEADVARWCQRFDVAQWPVVLVRAMGSLAWHRGYVFAPDYGWSRLLRGPLAVVSVDGDHLGVLVPPYVGRLGDEVRKLLT